MRRSRFAGWFLPVTLLAVVFALAAAPAMAQRGGPTRIQFTVTLTSQQRILEEVGRGGELTYGWNELTGTASTSSGNVDVRLLGNVEYDKGSGPFFGFLTLRFASLSTLGLRIVDGRATVKRDGTTALASRLRVIGGNAAMTGARGTGTIIGERRDELGGAIEITVSLRLRGVDG
jgi:hypothetical protein